MEKIFVDDLPQNYINKDYITSIYSEDSFEISFLFKSDFKNAKYLRDYLLVILDVIWINTTWKNRFVLVVDELNNNAIEYWSKSWSTNIMRFKSHKKWNEIFLNIEVEDAWDWEKNKNALEMDELRKQRLEKWFEEHKSIRWRWLFLIITKLVDELYFKDSLSWWLIVWVNKKLNLE